MSIGDIIQGQLQTDYMIVMNVSWEEDAMRCSWEEDGMMKVSSVLKFVGGLYDVGFVFGIISAAPCFDLVVAVMHMACVMVSQMVYFEYR